MNYLSILLKGTAVGAAMLLAPIAHAADMKAIAITYADIAHATYEESLKSARTLQARVGALTSRPSPVTLKAARQAWIAARVPYQQTEAYRFGNRIVDEWEGKVNAWPLDEGLIDYVDGDYGSESDENNLYAANVIANTSLKINGETVDTSRITKSLLQNKLQEAGGIEANVATGYHAIEFLLWGQDLNGTGPGAGNRPASDFDVNNCTGGHCDRRAAYLTTVTNLLVDDLTWMTTQWAPDGAHRFSIINGTAERLIRTIFTGLGSLSYGELAGERMKLGLILHDPEEEHDCFSDNTHNSHYYNALGIQNIYLGRYQRRNGTIVQGTGIAALVKERNPTADAALRTALSLTMKKMSAMVKRAQTVEAYDQMIGEGNAEGNAVVQAVIDALLAQTKAIERAVASVDVRNVSVEGSDSLDNPSAVSPE